MKLVSVVLPVYNCFHYVDEAIRSILLQSYQNIELVIVDDCSIDGTYEKIMAIDDSRIKLYRNSFNSGISKSLNFGILKSSGEYIARMDGDDISHLDRIINQVTFLELNSHIDVCGTGYKVIKSDKLFVPKSTQKEIVLQLTLDCPLAHPTVMFRKHVFEKFKYDPSCEPCEDIDLWTRMIKTINFANLPFPLLQYRIHSTQISSKLPKDQFVRSQRIIEKYIKSTTDQNLNFKYFSVYPILGKSDLVKYKSVELSFVTFWKNKGLKFEKEELANREYEYIRKSFVNNFNLRQLKLETIEFYLNHLGLFKALKLFAKKILTLLTYEK